MSAVVITFTRPTNSCDLVIASPLTYAQTQSRVSRALGIYSSNVVICQRKPAMQIMALGLANEDQQKELEATLTAKIQQALEAAA